MMTSSLSAMKVLLHEKLLCLRVVRARTSFVDMVKLTQISYEDSDLPLLLLMIR